MSTLLIRGASIPAGPEDRSVVQRDVMIERGVIRAIGEELPTIECEVLDATGMLLLPGFVDTHRHTWESLLRGLLPDATVIDYLEFVHGEVVPHVEPADLYTANLAGAIEALDAGITTLVDWCHACHSTEHAAAAVEGLAESGIRAVFAYGAPRHAPGGTVGSLPAEDVREIHDRQDRGDGRISLAVAATRAPDAVLLDDFKLARSLGVPISIHVDVGRPGGLLHEGLVSRLDVLGLMGPDVTYIHGSGCTAREFDRIAETGGGMSVSPATELQMGMGAPPILAARERGIDLGLSVDVVTSTGGDLFGQMKLAFAATRHELYLRNATAEELRAFTAREVLGFATMGGARVAGLGGSVGSVTVGRQADLVLLELDRPNADAAHDPAAMVVQSLDVSNVDTVLVGGVVLKRGGRLVEEVLGRYPEDLGARSDALLRRAGMRARGGGTA